MSSTPDETVAEPDEEVPERYEVNSTRATAVTQTEAPSEEGEPFADLWEASLRNPDPKPFTSSSPFFPETPRIPQEPTRSAIQEDESSEIEHEVGTPEITRSWFDSLPQEPIPPQDFTSSPPQTRPYSPRSSPVALEQEGEQECEQIVVCQHSAGWRRMGFLPGEAINPCKSCGEWRDWKAGHVYGCPICQERRCESCATGGVE